VKRLLLTCALLLAAGCAGRRAGGGEARAWHYHNDRGVTVVTAGAAVEQPVSDAVAITAQGLADVVTVVRAAKVVEDGGNQPTGHQHDDVDAVTSASVTVTGGDRLEKSRFEGTAGLRLDGPVAGAPSRLQAFVRYSGERDYRSYSGRMRLTTELGQRNTTISTFFGYGNDTVDPLEAPPGERAAWPAQHQRYNAGFSVSQLLGRRLSLALGGAASYQFGRLSNPYRRARVRSTLFPERLPDTRARLTLFATLSWYLGWETALHVRPGAYLDSWGVRAVIPEVALVRELGPRGLISLRYRY
jgi:hypothetical protein